MNKKNVLMVLLITLILFAVIVIFLCTNQKKVSVPDDIKIILSAEEIYGLEIIKIGKYEKFEWQNVKIRNGSITSKELQEYVELQMEKYSEIIPIEDRDIVENGDVVYVSYNAYKKDSLLKNVEHDNLIVGKGYYNEDIEKFLVGKCIGEPLEMLLTDENDDKVRLEILVESINYFKTYDLTDEFAKEKLGVDSVEEYYVQCTKELEKQKQIENMIERENELFEDLAEICKFKVDMNEIANYSMDLLKEYENIAGIYGMDLESYVVTVLNKEVEDFYQECYDKSELELKKYLIIGAIFNDKKMKISLDEFEDECENLGYEKKDIENDEYKKAIVRYNIMKKKVLELYL